MSEPNELIPPGAGNERPHDHSQARQEYRSRLRTPLEISEATGQINGMVALGLMPEARARVLLSGLKMQLGCTLAANKGGPSSSPSSMNLDLAVGYFEHNPEALKSISPSMDPGALQDILRRLAGGEGT